MVAKVARLVAWCRVERRIRWSFCLRLCCVCERRGGGEKERGKGENIRPMAKQKHHDERVGKADFCAVDETITPGF